jgi:hypothetical protein
MRRNNNMTDEEIRIFKDGDQWCAFRGTDLQTGASGFGEHPTMALDVLLKNEYSIAKLTKEYETIKENVKIPCKLVKQECDTRCPFMNPNTKQCIRGLIRDMLTPGFFVKVAATRRSVYD